MVATFRVVGTPIGNVGDMAPRATEALATAAIVLAEDTRKSRPLLDRLGVSTKLISCHAHNELDRLGVVLERLEAGESVALISDAGAPAISDPGGRLVAALVDAGHRIEVFPGPSAPIAALMGAGVDTSRYCFVGFLPRKGGKRQELLQHAASTGWALVLFEAPSRLRGTLEDLLEVFGPRRYVVARELTKLHETFHRGLLGEPMSPPLVEKGEAVVVVEAGEAQAVGAADPAQRERELLTDRTRPPKQRAKELAKVLGVSVSDAYSRINAAQQDPTEAVLAHLAAAARALASLPQRVATVEGITSEIDGADELLAMLATHPLTVAAPVEAEETAKAILGALSAADALQDALEMMGAVERDRSEESEN